MLNAPVFEVRKYTGQILYEYSGKILNMKSTLVKNIVGLYDYIVNYK